MSKFFLIQIKEDDEPQFGLQINDEELLIRLGFAWQCYGVGLLKKAVNVEYIGAKQFVDGVIQSAFFKELQKSCIVSNKIFGVLIDAERNTEYTTNVIKEVVLEGLSEQYALEKKYF